MERDDLVKITSGCFRGYFAKLSIKSSEINKWAAFLIVDASLVQSAPVFLLRDQFELADREFEVLFKMKHHGV